MLHFRRGNARDGLGQRQRALFDYNRVRQLGGDKVLERWARDLRKTPWPEGAPEGSRPDIRRGRHPTPGEPVDRVPRPSRPDGSAAPMRHPDAWLYAPFAGLRPAVPV